jgi:hypothetical protein
VKDTPLVVSQSSGRQRLNIHAAIDLETGRTRSTAKYRRSSRTTRAPGINRKSEIKHEDDARWHAARWRFSQPADLETMSAEDKRNTLIVEMTARTRTPEPHYYQQFNNDMLIGKVAVLIFLMRAKIRDNGTLRTITDDGQRNILVVEHAAHTQLTGSELQGMTNQQLVHVGLSWFEKEHLAT